MKLFLRVTTIIVFLVAVDVLFYSCRKPKEYNYKYTEAQFQLSEYNAASNYIRYLNTDGDSADLNFLEIDVQLKSEVLAFNLAAPGLLFSNAYAFTFYNHYTNTSRLKRVELKTIEDFNADFKAGSNLQDSLTFGLGYSNSKTDSFKSATALIEAFNNYPEYISNMDKMAYYGRFWIKFSGKKPRPNMPQQFALEIKLEDGTILRDTTVRFMVK